MSEAHPHDLVSTSVPVRVPPDVLREFSRIDTARAVRAVATEWFAVATAAAIATRFPHPLMYLAAVVLIGARQHAMLVIAHDAAHFRFLPKRFANDLVANLFLSWPTFASVQLFRHFHGPHHRHLGAEGDGNRQLWSTHDAQGRSTAEWTYPKSRAALAGKILRRGAFVTGAWWVVRGTVGDLWLGGTRTERALHAAWMVAVAALFTATHAWGAFFWFWIVPYCTWHLAAQYMRLICEHSVVPGQGAWALTRTTVATPIESLLLLPRNIGYHIEHHWFPSVPFYRLPELHAWLQEQPDFADNAVVSRSLMASLGSVTVR